MQRYCTFSQWTVDYRCMESIIHFVFHGMPPGGMCESLLQNHLESAKLRAGIALQPKYNGGVDIVQNMHDALTASLSNVCWGSESAYGSWVQHGGLQGAPTDKRLLFKLSIPDPTLWLELCGFRSIN